MRDIAQAITAVQRAADDRGVTYRSGRVIAWSPSSTTVRVDGVDLVDLPRLASVTGLSPGHTVALLSAGGTYLIVGRVVRP